MQGLGNRVLLFAGQPQPRTAELGRAVPVPRRVSQCLPGALGVSADYQVPDVLKVRLDFVGEPAGAVMGELVEVGGWSVLVTGTVWATVSLAIWLI